MEPIHTKMKANINLRIITIITAATIGSGMFAIPYIIQTAGWFVTLAYFVALGAVISLAHILYLRTLDAVHEKERLLGLARHYFGISGFWIGFFAIVLGFLLSLVAYLVLGAQFIHVISPHISLLTATFMFWLIIIAITFWSGSRAASLEMVGVALITCAIIFTFASGHPLGAFTFTPIVNARNILLPFGAVIFSLAGWTSVEQVYEIRRRKEHPGGALHLFIFGAAFAGALYWLFALGVLGSSQNVAIDTISGVGGWPIWKKDILAAIGLLAISVVSIPLVRELRGALEKDLHWNSFVSRLVIVGVPLIVVLSGFNNFLIIIGLAGGIFISTEYLLIIAVGRRVLSISAREKILLDGLAIIFVCAAVYEIITFVVK